MTHQAVRELPSGASWASATGRLYFTYGGTAKVSVFVPYETDPDYVYFSGACYCEGPPEIIPGVGGRPMLVLSAPAVDGSPVSGGNSQSSELLMLMRSRLRDHWYLVTVIQI